MKIYQVTSDEWHATRKGNPVTRHPSPVTCRGFTMVEIAISLAIIGIALVAIIGVLPLGMRMQRDNREATVINQDATILLEDIRGGARGADDLVNYVLMITNTYTHVAYSNPRLMQGPPAPPNPILTSGAAIVGLLSTPEFVDANFQPATAANAVYSNRMVAFVYSLTGPAVEKPPQPTNSLVRQSSFSYGVICENLPAAHYVPPPWSNSQPYNPGDTVSFVMGNGQLGYWQANVITSPADVPTNSPNWSRVVYPQAMDLNMHELRLLFLWPLLPDSSPPRVHYGTGFQTYRALVPGQLVLDRNLMPGVNMYFFQSQTFTNAP